MFNETSPGGLLIFHCPNLCGLTGNVELPGYYEQNPGLTLSLLSILT